MPKKTEKPSRPTRDGDDERRRQAGHTGPRDEGRPRPNTTPPPPKK
jgi:hypothetical protein